MTQGNDAPMTLRSAVQSFVTRAARLFPTELLHEIITLILSRYLSNILIAPASTRSWDAIGTLLHVDYHFRSCTLSVLNALWDGDFVDRKTGHPRNYTHKIEYLRGLAEFAHTNPKEVLPPKRHVLFMRPNTAPYERIGRYFIACQAEMNMILLGDVCCDLHDNLSKLSMAFSALPNGLHRRMLGEFADYVVSNFLVWIRAFSFRKLANKANWSVDMFFEDNVVTDRFEESLRDARQCMQKVCGYAESLGRDEDSVECGVLSRDAVSRNLFEMLLPKMRRLQAQGGTGGGVCDAWMSTLGVLLTSKEREAYGIASASRD